MALVLFFLVCFAVAFAGARVTRPAIATWYITLDKPSWTPPNWLFAPAWTALYSLMAVAAWLVWRNAGLWSLPLALFAIQLALNAAWSWLFFGKKSPGAAMLDISLLWLAILAATLAFARANRLAAWLMIPYLVWVAYAAALNFSVWRRNPRSVSA
jgi:tryptophan-rich sensory protein